MSERYTKRDAEQAFVTLMRAIGGSYNPLNLYNSYGLPNRYSLSFSATEGGWCVYQMDERGQERLHPHGNTLDPNRRPTREFVRGCWFAVRLLESAGLTRWHQEWETA